MGDYEEVMVEAASLEEKLAWLAALNSHTHYIEASLNIASNAAAAAAAHAEGGHSAKHTATASTAANVGATAGAAAAAAAAHNPATAAVTHTAAAATPAVVSVITATNDPKPWMVYLNQAAGESVVLCGLVNKPNPMGAPLMRELILTSHKRLVYVDTKTLEAKGEIDWKTENGVEPFMKIVS